MIDTAQSSFNVLQMKTPGSLIGHISRELESFNAMATDSSEVSKLLQERRPGDTGDENYRRVGAGAESAAEQEEGLTFSQPKEELNRTANMVDREAALFFLTAKRELSLKEQQEVSHLEQIERSVREHERSHMRAARDLAMTSPSYEFKRGPDGRNYAVGGEVNVDASLSGANAEETIDKARKIQNAALAPNDPSPKDQRAAVTARIIESKAYRKLSREESLEVIVQNKEKDHEHPEDQLFDKSLPVGFSQYRQNLEFQKNLSSMLDLFT